MIAHPAQYLLRLDDLCPTHDHERWRRFSELIAEFGLRPILAIVPDNRDPGLTISEPDPNFWSEMRAQEAAGAAIGLHGYRHLCMHRGRSLVPFHRETEFAGVAEDRQGEWIREGLRILRDQGLHPSIWVAPRHGFDRGTLRALRGEGIRALSDGFAGRPYQRDGVTWIPQQLWAPADKAEGLWTICMHPNTTTDGQFEALRAFAGRHAGQFTSVAKVLAEYVPTQLTAGERIAEKAAVARIRARRVLRRGLRRD